MVSLHTASSGALVVHGRLLLSTAADVSSAADVSPAAVSPPPTAAVSPPPPTAGNLCVSSQWQIVMSASPDTAIPTPATLQHQQPTASHMLVDLVVLQPLPLLPTMARAFASDCAWLGLGCYQEHTTQGAAGVEETSAAGGESDDRTAVQEQQSRVIRPVLVTYAATLQPTDTTDYKADTDTATAGRVDAGVQDAGVTDAPHTNTALRVLPVAGAPHTVMRGGASTIAPVVGAAVLDVPGSTTAHSSNAQQQHQSRGSWALLLANGQGGVHVGMLSSGEEGDTVVAQGEL